MTLGGFVIFGNSRDTLPACLDGLAAVSDEVVAVDSGSRDGSREIVEARGIRTADLPWQGYGAARARAVDLLGRHDYVFFLDSDERLADGSLEAFRRWRASKPALPFYRLTREDWVELGGERFRYRSEGKNRLIRRDMARWTPGMIVHESLPRADLARMGAVIEHRFATSLEELGRKQVRYALLWALEAHARGRRAPPAALDRVHQWAHFVRDTIVKGALVRVGPKAVPVALMLARYHADKYRALRRVEQGAYAALEARLARGELRELFRDLDAVV